jgi:hypothetical protein
MLELTGSKQRRPLSILIMLPYIPLFIIDSSNDEREKLRRESDASS